MDRARQAERGRPRHPAVRQPITDTHIVLLARDAEGYANLCRLITDAHMLGERSDPSVMTSQICAHAGGLVALLGPRSAPGRLAVAGGIDAARRAAEPFRDAFGRDRCFVAVEHRVERESHDEMRAMLRFAERLEVGAVATNPVRYLVPEDAFLARRARVHAEDRAHRAEPRHPCERRGISEAFTTDACAVP